MKAEESTHHRLGGSTSERWFTCAYSVPAIEHAREAGVIPKEQPAGDAAMLGTAAHTLKEKCHETGCDPVEYLGEKIRVGNKSFLVDAHMVDNVTSAVDYCREVTASIEAEFIQPEFNSELGHLFDGQSIGGPCDYLAIGPNTLFIDDYKNGTYSVEVENNKQFLLYAAGCYEWFKNTYEIKNVLMAVSQPNCNHEKGKNRSWQITARQLKRWIRKELTPAVKRVEHATELFKQGRQDELIPVASEKGCFWCPLSGVCRTYDEYQNKDLVAEFKTDDLPDPNLLTVEEAEHIISIERRVKKWFEQVREYRKHALENGDTSTKFKLVQSKTNRQWRNEKRAARRLRKVLKNPDLIKKEPEINSPAQIEKILVKHTNLKTKEAKAFVDALTHREIKGVAMAPMEDGREALTLGPVADFADDN